MSQHASAFPSCDADGNGPAGLTRLEWFAGQALCGLCADSEIQCDADVLAKSAFDIAEAMCAEAEKRKAAK